MATTDLTQIPTEVAAPLSLSAEAIRKLGDRYPEVTGNIVNLNFPGRRQRNTPVTNAKGIVEIIMLLPGRQAARVRRQAAELLVRYLGGDLTIVDEVCRIRSFQEEMAAQRPEDPRRIFGEAVEASGSHGPVGEQLVRIMSTVERRLTAQDEILERIQQRLSHDRQHVNLNVRAPKRPLPRDPPIVRDIVGAGRPFPVAKFLTQQSEKTQPGGRPGEASHLHLGCSSRS